MKKIILLFGILFSVVCSASALDADQVVGKWESNPVKHDPTPEMPMAVTEKHVIDLRADMTFSYKSEGQMNMDGGDGVSIDIFLKSECEGTYTCDGDAITLTPNADSVKINFTEDDVRVRGVEDPQQAEAITQGLYQQLQMGFAETQESFAEPTVLENVVVTGPKMMAKMDDQMVNFKRKKK